MKSESFRKDNNLSGDQTLLITIQKTVWSDALNYYKEDRRQLQLCGIPLSSRKTNVRGLMFHCDLLIQQE